MMDSNSGQSSVGSGCACCIVASSRTRCWALSGPIGTSSAGPLPAYAHSAISLSDVNRSRPKWVAAWSRPSRVDLPSLAAIEDVASASAITWDGVFAATQMPRVVRTDAMSVTGCTWTGPAVTPWPTVKPGPAAPAGVRRPYLARMSAYALPVSAARKVSAAFLTSRDLAVSTVYGKSSVGSTASGTAAATTFGPAALYRITACSLTGAAARPSAKAPKTEAVSG